MHISTFQDWIGYVAVMGLIGYGIGRLTLKMKLNSEENKTKMTKLNQSVFETELDGVEIEKFDAQPEKP